MPKLNVQQNNQNVIQAFKNALAIGNLKGIIASDGNHNFSTAGSNRNLLDNPWFGSGEIINQRGTASGLINNGSYIADRWITTTADITYNDTGIIYASRTNNDGFRQRCPHSRMESGKTYTASLMTSDGTVYSNQFVAPALNANVTTVLDATIGLRCYVQKLSTVYQVYFYTVTSGTEIDCRAVKLELGSVSTLANDAPPDYAEELLKCKRYFQRISGYLSYIGTGYCDNTTEAYFLCPLSVPLRSKVVTLSHTGVYLNSTNITAVTGLIILRDGNSVNDASIALKATASGLTAKAPALLQIRAENGYIDLSADL